MSSPMRVLISPPSVSASFKASATRARLVAHAAARPLHSYRDPGGVHQVCQALGHPHDRGRDRVGADAGENALARGPGAFYGLRLHAFDEVGIDPLRRAPER